MSTVILLCGGLNIELRPFTDYTPKCLLPIKNKTILEWNLEWLEKNNFKNVIINESFCIPQMELAIKKYKGSLKIQQRTEKILLGTAQSVYEYSFGLDEDFIVINGDNLYNFDLRKMYESHLKTDANCTVAIHDTTKHEKNKSVVKLTENGMIEKIIPRSTFKFKKPTAVFAGVGVVKPKFREQINLRKDVDFWSNTLSRKSEQLIPYKINEGLTCFNSPSEYNRINETYRTIDHFFIGHERY